MTNPTPADPTATVCDPDDIRTRVADEVRSELGRQRMSTNTLAERTGIDPATMQRRCRGESPGFRVDELVRVARALCVRTEKLLGGM